MTYFRTVTDGKLYVTPLTDSSFIKSSDPLPDSPATEYYAGGAIKALKDEGEMGGYLVNWGSPLQRDKTKIPNDDGSVGEWFTPNTEYRLDYYDTRPVLFHHGLGDADSVKIGEIYDLSKDDKGIYARARLYLTHEDPQIRYYANRAWERVKQDELFWSSGSIAHLVEKTAQGEITKWPIVEGSLTPTPAEPVRTKVDALKTACSELFCSTDEPPIESATKEDRTPVAQTTDMKAVPKRSKTSNRKVIKMLDQAAIDALLEKGLSAEQVLAVIGTLGDQAAAPEPEDAMMAEGEPAPEEEPEEEPFRSAQTNGVSGKAAGGKRIPAPKPDNSNALLLMQMAEIRKEIKAIKTAPPVETVPGRNGNKQNTTVRVASKYEHLELADMGYLKSVMDAVTQIKGRGSEWQPKDARQFYNELAIKAEKSGMGFSPETTEMIRAIKSDEVNYSTQTGFGDEYVPELWSSDLWRKPRMDNVVYANGVINIAMPSDPYKLPIQGADPTVSAVPETTNENQLTLADSNSPIPDTKIGTSNTTLNAAKLGLRITVSGELDEDSIIPVAALWREQSLRAMEDGRDAVILSADATTGTSNINNDGGSIGATNKFVYGGGDGFLHLPLVDNTALAVNMNNVAPTLIKIREARGKLNRTLFQKRGELVYFCDPETLLKIESLDEAVVTTINGVGSTFEGREVKAIDGIPVFATDQMGLATATGVVSSTAGNNTRGRLLLVHRPSWYVGFRRDIRLTFDYLSYYDAWVLVVTMRMAMVRRATDVASLLYNIAV